MMQKYFITATGTNIGKTLVTCALAAQLLAQGKMLKALKPVISGFDMVSLEQTDSGQLLLAQGVPLTSAALDAISPWRLKAALSPDMAGEEEGVSLALPEIVRFCESQSGVDYLLVEGIGGVMVPLNDTKTTLDWMAALGYHVILVTGSYLGAISHTLSACAALTAHGLAPHAIIISESEESPVPCARLKTTLRRFLPEAIRIHTIPRLDSSPDLWKYVPTLTQILA